MALVRFLLVCVAAGAAFGADAETLLKQIARYEHGDPPAAVRELDALAYRAAGDPAAAAPLERLLVAFLESDATPAAKDAVVRNLSIVGTAASVPVLSRMLADPKTSDMARYALERIPAPEAAQALRGALARTDGLTRIGVVNTLGRRRDTASVPSIAPLLRAGDPDLASAAATALGNIGGPEARKALLEAPQDIAVAESLLKIAEQDLRSNRRAEAAAIYQRLQASTHPPVRTAALLGSAAANPQAALPELRAILRKAEDAGLQAAAIRSLAEMQNPEAGKLLMEGLAQAPAAARVQIVAAVDDRHQPGMLPWFTKAAEDSELAVRVAALQALGTHGGASAIPLLAARAASAEGSEREAARLSLARVRGPETDAAILSGIRTADPEVKVEFIRAAGERGIRSAPEVLLEAAKDPDTAVRQEAVRALRETAAPPHAPKLIALLQSAGAESERKELERTVAAAIRRSPKPSVESVLAAWRSESAVPVKASLLSVVGMIGAGEGLPMVREALQSGDSALQRAAILSMSEWPNTTPLEDLLQLAKSGGSLSQRVLALRGYVNLVRLPSSRTPAESARLLAPAMEAAPRPEEKKLVLAALQRFICPESLEMAKAAAADPAVAAEAKLAVSNLERGLSYRR